MAYGSHTLGRTFSVSALDGIEVKVSDNFKPIERVALPMRYRAADPTDVLQVAQYDFGTETAFLNWLKEKKKNDAAKEAAKEAARKAQQDAAAAAAAAKQGQQTAAPPQPISTTTNNAVSPVMTGLSQDILMPTQLHSGAPTTQTVPPKITSQTSFDPRDFENSASDPFETTELQTLNDMDELRAVLGNSVPQVPPQQQQVQGSIEQSGPQAPAQNQLCNAQQNHSAANNGTVTDASPSEPEYQNIQKQHDYQNVQRHDYQNVQQGESSQPDYQNVQIETSTGQVSFKPGKPPLPPRNQNQTAPNGGLNPSLLPNGIADMPEGADKAGTMNLNFGRRTPLPPISPSTSRENTNTSISSSSSSGGGGGPQTTGTQEVPERSGPSPRSRSPPPGYYAPDYGTTNPASPMPGAVPLPGLPPELPPSYPESFNHQTLPTYLCSVDMSLSPFTPLPASPLRTRTLSEEERMRPDPIYDVMTTEDKNFVMTIMSMGFPKSRTSRAVKRLGKDDRLVVELLCAVETLCSEGFPEDRSEEALNLHDSDQQKAKDFLKLWKQFEELGFKGDDIKRELIVHGNNEEKVLDSLTA